MRCYAVRDETDAWGGTGRVPARAMRLEKPDDELGSMLFLSLPSLVVHRLDAWSPLVPPDWWVEARYRRKRGRRAARDVGRRRRDLVRDFAEYAYRYPAPLRARPTPKRATARRGGARSAGKASRPIRRPAAPPADEHRTNRSTARSRRRTTPR